MGTPLYVLCEKMDNLEARLDRLEAFARGDVLKGVQNVRKTPVDRVLGHIMRAGPSGITKTELTNKTQGLNADLRNDALRHLINSRQIVKATTSARRGLQPEIYKLAEEPQVVKVELTKEELAEIRDLILSTGIREEYICEEFPKEKHELVLAEFRRIKSLKQ